MAIKKPGHKQATSLRHQPPRFGWFTGLLVGLMLGGTSVFYLLSIQPKKQVVDTATTAESETKKTEGDKKKSGGPRFDFYKLLPENAAGKSIATSPLPATTTAPASAFDTDNDVTTTPSATTNIPVETHQATADGKLPGVYLLQAGSFRSAEEADKLRANVLLLGLPARVESAKNDKGETLYRIYVGSFATAEAMENAQSTLTANKINSVVVKQK
jgi:cell division protein FtsN